LRAALAALLLAAASVAASPAAARDSVASASSAAVVPAWEWRLPTGFPAPLEPADNPMSAAKVELGRHLFYDRRLSGNRTQACASCHRQEHAFTDGLPQAVGSTGEKHRRSAMSLANVAYAVTLTWSDPEMFRLEEQALVPMLGTQPVELGLAGLEAEVEARLAADPRYTTLFAAAFPGVPDPIRLENVVRALACFERTLLSGNSPYDQVVFQGRMEAMSESAWRGMRLFYSARLACSQCHAGFNFSGPVTYAGLPETPPARFHNTGLYNVDGRGAYPAIDRGLLEHTGRRRDMGRFKAPTLRNITLTAPYMHDGSLPTLESVLDHYARGGRAGGKSRSRSPLVAGFALDEGERRDLLAFLASLTDESFVTDPRFGDSWQEDGVPADGGR
jgi:cytochrome c peroxidase